MPIAQDKDNSRKMIFVDIVDIFSPLFIAGVAGAYLLGAVPSAVIISRLMRLPDPRSYGSGNVGATNVARSGNRIAAILTLLADGGKGAAAVFLAAVWLAGLPGLAEAPAAAGFAAVLGHVTSPFLRFRGGRGVATALAVIASLQPVPGLAALGIWAAVFAVSRYSSLASLCATTAATALYVAFAPPAQAVAVAAINLLIIVRHADNIRRLFAGEEGGFKR